MANRAPDRHDRRVENELMFQKLNERYEASIKDYLDSDDYHSHQLEYVCECSSLDCLERIPVTIAQYRSIHRQSDLFIVKPGHEQLDIEAVAERTDQYVVVAKIAIAP